MVRNITQLDEEIAYAQGVKAGFAKALEALNNECAAMLWQTKPQLFAEWEKREWRLLEKRATLRKTRA